MKILVTGGAGFIGRWLVKRLLEDSHKVWILDDLSRGKKKNLEEFNDKIEQPVYNSVTNTKALEELFKNNFDLVLHLASTCDVQLSIDNPEEVFEADVRGTFNVLEQVRKQEKPPKFIFMSSCMVYDTANEPLTERSPLKASSPYAAAKICGENLTLAYHHAYGLDCSVLRPFNTYGPHGLFAKNRGEGGVIPIFLKRKAKGEKLKVYGSGEQTRDFLFVDDCVEMLMLAIGKDIAGMIIHGGSGHEVSVNELARIITNESEIEHVEHHHPQSEVQRLVADNSVAEKILGWKPKTNLEEGIKKTQEWISKNPEILED